MELAAPELLGQQYQKMEAQEFSMLEGGMAAVAQHSVEVPLQAERLGLEEEQQAMPPEFL